MAGVIRRESLDLELTLKCMMWEMNCRGLMMYNARVKWALITGLRGESVI